MSVSVTLRARTSPLPRRWRLRSVLLLALPWLLLQFGGLFSPGLLDDVDSVYLEVAREMLVRHDFITPYVDGIRFFDKPPLMYWAAAASMHLFGVHAWAGRLPLALGVALLVLAVYALGIRLFAAVSPPGAPDRGGFYAALATLVSVGPYLYTRFYIPDVLLALWMTLAVHLTLVALERVRVHRSALLPSLGFGAVAALAVLTKGLIGVLFPLAFVLLYLLASRQGRLWTRLRPGAATLAFLSLAGPWHVLAALRNPAVPMPRGVGLPARAGWAWFYLYNEHIARFLGRRIPHDYGQVPVLLFWLLLLLWMMPWTAFLPAALLDAFRSLRPRSGPVAVREAAATRRETPLALLLWAGIILGFFTFGSRQEYYHLPALPALALLLGGLLSTADCPSGMVTASTATLSPDRARCQVLAASAFFLAPLGLLLAALCGWTAFTAGHPAPGSTLSSALRENPALYTLSLGHVFDLTGTAMGWFRGPLLTVAVAMLGLGPGAWLVRRRGHTWAANLLLGAAMTVVLLAAHEGLVRFYPILGSKSLAEAIVQVRRPGDAVAIDGELTSGSTLLFYTRAPVLLVNGRVNGPWFGSFWPDAPHIFLNDADLARRWASPQRLFLLTQTPALRREQLRAFGTVAVLASAGGKTVLSNH